VGRRWLDLVGDDRGRETTVWPIDFSMLLLINTRIFREYDVSVDTDEPQQILSFLPDRSRRSFLAEDASERQVASFTFGKGQADWGPLTVYAVMKSGDVYSICPYMPKNA